MPTTKLRLRFSGFTSPLVVVSASEIGPFTVMVSVFTWPVTGSFIGTALVMERREMSSRSG